LPTKDEIREFSQLIEELSIRLRCGRIEAILEHCKSSGMEIEVASTLISSALKSNLHEEAENLNLIKKSSKLPV
jgi:hypothetical protein